MTPTAAQKSDAARLRHNYDIGQQAKRTYNIKRLKLRDFNVGDVGGPVEHILPPFMNRCTDIIISYNMASHILDSLLMRTTELNIDQYVCISSFGSEYKQNTGIAFIYKDKLFRYHLYSINDVVESK